MGHDRADLRVHADQLRRQGRGRAGRAAHHGRPPSGAREVRPDRLVVLLPVRPLGGDRGLHHQPRADAPHAPGDGDRVVAGAVPDAGHGQPGSADRLPHHPGRGRGTGRAGRHPRHLQMVSRFAPRHADRHHRPGLGAGRHRCGTGAELHHRPLFLALGVRRPGHRRPPVDRAVADLRPRGHPGRCAGPHGPARRRRARALPLPAHLPKHRGRLRRGLRQLLGPRARPHLVHLVPGGRAGLQPGSWVATSASCPGSSACSWCWAAARSRSA